MRLKNKYIIFNNADYKDGSNDKDGYCTICLHDLNHLKGVEVVGGPMPKMHSILAYLIIILRKLRVPCIFLKPFVKSNKQDSRDLCVLFLRIFDATYLTWLRLQYPKAKFVLFLRDLYETKQPHVSNYCKEHLIDYWGTYDMLEKEQYSMDFFYPEIESKIDLSSISEQSTCDVFFAGAAKKRLSQILEAYDYFTSHGIKCHFIIMDADEKEFRDGIEYINEFMPYRRMLELSVQANCILEISQEGAVGNTSRFLEAVIYNKKLITNNKGILNEKYYNPKFMKVFGSITDISLSFINEQMDVDYGYAGDFSPVGLIKCIDNVISK